MIPRRGNTGREIVESGEFSKVGRKRYQHIDGAVIAYDCNAWGWRIDGEREVYTALHAAVSHLRYRLSKQAEAAAEPLHFPIKES